MPNAVEENAGGDSKSHDVLMMKDCILPPLFLLRSSNPPCTWFVFYFVCCCSISEDRLDAVGVFWGFFVVYAVVAKAGGATFPPGLSAIVSRFHKLRGYE